MHRQPVLLDLFIMRPQTQDVIRALWNLLPKTVIGLVMDTIIAIATPPQNGAIGVIRLSGPQSCLAVLPHLRSISGHTISQLAPRVMTFVHFVDAAENILDKCLAVHMPAPHSFTGEDVVELHCHGNLILLRTLLRTIFSSTEGVRSAEPGEFSRRAFVNGKMDLSQAEAVHALITSESEQSARSALANLDGRLSRLVNKMRDELVTALALVEAGFEFPEEDIQTYDRHEIFTLIDHIQNELLGLKSAFRTSKIIDHGISVALVGRPNVGKSSLLNALLVEDRALVTSIAGTTRDVVEGHKMIDGVRFIFRDTAGLRSTDDIVESAGIQKAREWIEKSDVVVCLSDQLDDDGFAHQTRPDQIVFFALNKIDLFTLSHETIFDVAARLKDGGKFDLFLSVRAGFGIDKLETMLSQIVTNTHNVQNSVHINERQLCKINVGLEIISQLRTLNHVGASDEFLAEDLRRLISVLGEMTGAVTSEDVLSEIFKRFCVGK